ncbi:hypothetical protein Acr_18g0006290 [Actinidia rufa]|uniref:Uncharacterized protein n=1 Tax=Actinidia rufa TaxID=165716 RepID=A0A7J0G6R3_9ERIC|nr:hypothetical protein Acr_18g0006290 [Actinidia rufa]
MSAAHNSVETVNAAATAIVTAASRVQPTPVQKQAAMSLVDLDRSNCRHSTAVKVQGKLALAGEAVGHHVPTIRIGRVAGRDRVVSEHKKLCRLEEAEVVEGQQSPKIRVDRIERILEGLVQVVHDVHNNNNHDEAPQQPAMPMPGAERCRIPQLSNSSS